MKKTLTLLTTSAMLIGLSLSANAQTAQHRVRSHPSYVDSSSRFYPDRNFELSPTNTEPYEFNYFAYQAYNSN